MILELGKSFGPGGMLEVTRQVIEKNGECHEPVNTWSLSLGLRSSPRRRPGISLNNRDRLKHNTIQLKGTIFHMNNCSKAVNFRLLKWIMPDLFVKNLHGDWFSISSTLKTYDTKTKTATYTISRLRSTKLEDLGDDVIEPGPHVEVNAWIET